MACPGRCAVIIVRAIVCVVHHFEAISRRKIYAWRQPSGNRAEAGRPDDADDNPDMPLRGRDRQPRDPCAGK
jgi:hypothetical protein